MLLAYDYLFAAFALVLGAVVGSFLNVCIYRLPRDLSVNQPRRSFCPHCKAPIPWHRNIPLLSWLLLRGRCADCHARIPFRYFGVELLTALLFLGVWLKVWPDAWLLALPYWILVSLLITATFIDFEFFIIPDEITWGGVAAGVLLSFALPPLMGETSALRGLMWSLIGAAVGYGLLWSVVQLGKLAFGKKRIAFDKAEPFTWTRDGDDADFTVGTDTTRWSEIFSRETDQLLVTAPTAEIAGKTYTDVVLRFYYNRVVAGSDTHQLDQLDTLRGTTTEINIPREAMGFGDVKFIAAIGAFLGWQAVLFTIMSASVLGAAVGLLTIALGRREWSAKIPFGPYLALGALVWLFTGPAIVAWYLGSLEG